MSGNPINSIGLFNKVDKLVVGGAERLRLVGDDDPAETRPGLEVRAGRRFRPARHRGGLGRALMTAGGEGDQRSGEKKAHGEAAHGGT